MSAAAVAPVAAAKPAKFSNSKAAGLQFSINGARKSLKTDCAIQKLDVGVAIEAAAVLEVVTRLLLMEADVACTNANRSVVQPKDLARGLQANPELAKLLNGVLVIPPAQKRRRKLAASGEDDSDEPAETNGPEDPEDPEDPEESEEEESEEEEAPAAKANGAKRARGVGGGVPPHRQRRRLRGTRGGARRQGERRRARAASVVA